MKGINSLPVSVSEYFTLLFYEHIGRNVKLLLIYIGIGIISAIIIGTLIYQRKIESLKNYAQDSFKKALLEEIQKRNVDDFYYSSQGYTNDINDNSQEDKLISLTSALGSKDFIIPNNKYRNNIERSSCRLSLLPMVAIFLIN